MFIIWVLIQPGINSSKKNKDNQIINKQLKQTLIIHNLIIFECVIHFNCIKDTVHYQMSRAFFSSVKINTYTFTKW